MSDREWFPGGGFGINPGAVPAPPRISVSKVTAYRLGRPASEYPWLCRVFGHRKQARYVRGSFGGAYRDDTFYYQDCLRRGCFWSQME